MGRKVVTMPETKHDSKGVLYTDPGLKTILDASPVGIVVFEPDARVVYANPPAQALFEMSNIAAAGMKCGDFIGCSTRFAHRQECGHTKDCPQCPLFRAICAVCSSQPDPTDLEGEAFLDRTPPVSGIWVKYRVVGISIGGRKFAVMAIDDITRQKGTEEQLRSAITELSVIHEHAPIAMMLVDRDRRVQKVNGFAAQFADRPAEEMIGMRGGEALRCLHHLDDPQGCGFGPACADCHVRKAVLNTFDTGISHNEVEEWLPFPRGTSTQERCLLISTAFLKIDGSERVLVCAQDITERKRAEKILEKEREKFFILTENAPFGMIVIDENGVFQYVNYNFTLQFGYDLADVPNGKSWFRKAFPDPEYRKTVIQKWNSDKESAKIGENRPRVFTVRCKDGEKKIVNFISVKLTTGEDLVACEDITARKRAEDALIESEQRLQAILESNANPIVVYDAKGFPQYLNPAFTEVFGWTLDELIGQRIPFVPKDHKEITEAKIKEVYSSGAPAKFASQRLTKQGKTLDVIVSAAIIKGSEGDGTGMVVNLIDISEQRKLEHQLRQAQKMESVGRLAGGVAHDFNNMLSVILGYTEMALEQVDPTQSIHASLRETYKAAERSTHLTRQLLAFARKQTIAPKVLDLNETVEGMLKMLRRLIGEDIDLAWWPGAEIWSVRMDPAQIDQILANLCVNARDAIADVGKITIETGKTTFDEAYCAEHPGFISGDFVLLAVSDNGCGMDQETLNKLFEPFFTTKEVDKGTGLGLATVYGIVKQNNGFINVYSELGQGTSVKVYLPRHEVAPERMYKKAPSLSDAQGSETILVVEDELAILRMTQIMLERLGYTVLTAVTPGEAMELAREHSGEIDLLLTDVVMPEMNGRDLAKNLLSLYPNLKRLFMSGYTANVIAHHGVLDEGVQFIQKPFSKQDLAIKVREVLDESK
jgi:PAS domain S-box-containing protein